jgi:hypothetical protein
VVVDNSSRGHLGELVLFLQVILSIGESINGMIVLRLVRNDGDMRCV